MPVYIKNLQSVLYEVRHLPGPVTLQPAGDQDAVANVTSEIKGLASSQYADLQSDQVQGLISFEKSKGVVVSTPGLTISTQEKVYDEAMDARAATLQPASPVFFNCEGQPSKTIFVRNPNGACEIEFWGSIDTVTVDMAAKRYVLAGRYVASDPTMGEVDKSTLANLRGSQYIKADLIRGVSPEIMFRTTF